MITFNRFVLPNGLRLLVHTDSNTPMVAINVAYHVGSADEEPGMTGFAHLFEHLMFSGSLHVASFDAELEKVGGENNAFTTSDYTNYYMQVPAVNVETGFRLESDRMLSLAINNESLEIQRNVVLEEFKQNFLNKPYGDLWLEFKPLAYTKCPYRWPTIGADMNHIAQATLGQVHQFYQRFYQPSNAVLTIAGNIDSDEALRLTKKWFGNIPSSPPSQKNFAPEPSQKALRTLTVFKEVPYDIALLAWKMPGRAHPDYQAYELLAEMLAGGESSILVTKLVKETELLTEAECFLSEEFENGLFCLFLKPRIEGDIYSVVDTVVETINHYLNTGITEHELEKVKNKALTGIAMSRLSIQNKAIMLALAELLGDCNRINNEPDRYNQITSSYLQQIASNLFQPQVCSILYYRSKKK